MRNHIAFDAGEPDLHWIEPRRIGRGEVQFHIWVILQERCDFMGLVGRQVIEDKHGFLPGFAQPDYVAEEIFEFLAGAASHVAQSAATCYATATRLICSKGADIRTIQMLLGHADLFLPVKVLGRVCRRKFIRGLRRAFRQKKLRFSGAASALAAPKLAVRRRMKDGLWSEFLSGEQSGKAQRGGERGFTDRHFSVSR